MNPRLRRWEASEYLLRAHGVPVAASTLAKWVTVGGGPKFEKVNRTPLYSLEDLDAWVSEKTGAQAKPVLFEQLTDQKNDPDIVDLLALSVRSVHALKTLKVRTAFDLASVTEAEMKTVRGCGKLSVEEIKRVRYSALSSFEWVSALSPDLIFPLTRADRAA